MEDGNCMPRTHGWPRKIHRETINNANNVISLAQRQSDAILASIVAGLSTVEINDASRLAA
jgi:hypothetical protein